VVGFRHVEEQAERLLLLHLKRDFQPGAFRLLRSVEKLRALVYVELLLLNVPRPMTRRVARVGDNSLQTWMPALRARRRACGECRLADLIPEGDAGVVVLTLVPAHRLIVGILIWGNPAEMLDGHLDSGVEDHRIVQMPA